jgi:hypothetical protein
MIVEEQAYKEIKNDWPMERRDPNCFPYQKHLDRELNEHELEKPYHHRQAE